MSAPIAQLDIEAEISRLSALCEKATHELAKRARATAEADVAYQRKFFTTFVQAKGAMELRRAESKLACIDEYEVWRIAEAREKAAQEAGRNYRAQLDSLRSLNANHRSLVVGS